MRGLLLIGSLLCVSAASAAEKEKLVVLDLIVADSASTAADSPLARMVLTATEQMLTELSTSDRVSPIGRSDITALVGIEQQKQLLGCTEEATACLAEISGALGAPWLIAGTLSRVGHTLRVD